MPDTDPTKTWPKSQIQRLMFVLGGVLAILIFLYLLFLRYNYSSLYQNLQPEIASAIVTELDTREIRYRLKNDGTNIEVPASQVDAIRLKLIGTHTPLKTTDGFELFNETEMGLTDFAQKVKFQRALQGELARTIMAMDGVYMARVHISIPERALFREYDHSPRAAVTLAMLSGHEVHTSRIRGIQELTASTVPGLDVSHVVVLDNDGTVISADRPKHRSVPRAIHPKISAYRQHAIAALEEQFPGRIIDLQLKQVIPHHFENFNERQNTQPERTIGTIPLQSFKVELVSDVELNSEEQNKSKHILHSTMDSKISIDDQIDFKVQTPSFIAPVSEDIKPNSAINPSAPELVTSDHPTLMLQKTLFWGALTLLLIVFIILLLRKFFKPELSQAERDSLVKYLQTQLGQTSELKC